MTSPATDGKMLVNALHHSVVVSGLAAGYARLGKMAIGGNRPVRLYAQGHEHGCRGPKFDVAVPNEVHHADLLFLPHDRVGTRTYKYALTVVDVASRYKEAEPLATKGAKEVAEALFRIYRRGPLKWPKLLKVDPSRELMGSVSQLFAKHSVQIRHSLFDTYRDQGIVECFNRTLTERLFGH